jgi:hypothetical protein
LIATENCDGNQKSIFSEIKYEKKKKLIKLVKFVAAIKWMREKSEAGKSENFAAIKNRCKCENQFCFAFSVLTRNIKVICGTQNIRWRRNHRRAITMLLEYRELIEVKT